MNGNKCVLDSNLIIFFSKGKIDLAKLRSKYDEFYVSVITYMEVYAYDFDIQTEKDLTDKFFDLVEVVEIDEPLADQAIIYRKKQNQKNKTPRRNNPRHRKTHKCRFTNRRLGRFSKNRYFD